jgi:thioredoxin reductase
MTTTKPLPAITTPNAPIYDVLIVGGGLAGLGGALMLSRARRSVLVVDAGHPRNAPAEHTHGYLTRDGESPLRMLELGREEIRAYGNDIVSGEVTAIERRGADRFTVTARDGNTWTARRVLVTTGLVDELPDVPGLPERWGRDVVHCPYCFGWEIRDEPFGILATGPNAASQALMWRQWSSDIVLFMHTAPRPTEAQLEQLTARGISIVEGAVSGLDVTDDRLSGVRLDDGRVVPRSVLVVGPRFAARHALLEPLGVTTSEHPMGIGFHVDADPSGRTSAAGIWVAGNVLDVSAGIMQATASGVLAAAAINNDLINDDTDIAVQAARN